MKEHQSPRQLQIESEDIIKLAQNKEGESTVNSEKLKIQCAYYKEGYEELLKENQELKEKKKHSQSSSDQNVSQESLRTQISSLEKELADANKRHIIEIDRVKSQHERKERELKEEITLLR